MTRGWWAWCVVVTLVVPISSAAQAPPLLCRTPLALRIFEGGQGVAAVYQGAAKPAGPRGVQLEPGACGYANQPAAATGAHEILIKEPLRFQPLQDASFDAYRVQSTLNGTYGLAGKAAAFARLLSGTELILKILVERDLVVTGLGTDNLFVEAYRPPPELVQRVGKESATMPKGLLPPRTTP